MGDGRDRNDLIPDQQRRTGTGHVPDPVEPRDPHTEPVPRKRSSVWLYAVPVLALIVIGTIWMLRSEVTDTAPAFSTTGTTGERSGGNDPEGARAEPPLNPAAEGPAVISDIGLLSDKEQYAGRTVRFRAIPVFKQEGPRTFWVGRLTNRALVLADPEVAPPQLRSGELIALEGRLERRPDDKTLAAAGLSEDDRDAIEGEDVIIRASRVEPAPSAGANQGSIPERQQR